MKSINEAMKHLQESKKIVEDNNSKISYEDFIKNTDNEQISDMKVSFTNIVGWAFEELEDEYDDLKYKYAESEFKEDGFHVYYQAQENINRDSISKIKTKMETELADVNKRLNKYCSIPVILEIYDRSGRESSNYKWTLEPENQQTLKESIDVHEFNVYENSPYTKTICELLNCTPDDIKTITGYQMNDWEPTDFVANMEDGSGYLIDISKNKVIKYPNAEKAERALFSNGANYNF